MKKKVNLLMLVLMVSLAFLLSSFVKEEVPGEGNGQKPYTGNCPNGKKITVCGANGSHCIPKGDCVQQN